MCSVGGMAGGMSQLSGLGPLRRYFTLPQVAHTWGESGLGLDFKVALPQLAGQAGHIGTWTAKLWNWTPK